MDSSSEEPKKQKIKIRDKSKKNKSKPKKKISSKQNYPTLMLQMNEKAQTFVFEPDKKEKGFGKNERYSLRNRIPRLNHENGERVEYVDRGNGLEIDKIILCTNQIGYGDILNRIKYDINHEEKERKNNKKTKKNKKLVKGGGIENDDEFAEKLDKNNEFNEYDSQLLDSQKFSEYGGENDTIFIRIPEGGKKDVMRNYSNILIIKVLEALGKNLIKVDGKEYKNVHSGQTITVKKNQFYEILNFSKYDLVVQILIDEEYNEDDNSED